MVGNIVNAYTTWRYRLVEITPAYAADQLMDSMSDGVVLIDRDGMVRLVNPAASEILGIDRAAAGEPSAARASLPQDVLGWQHQPVLPLRATPRSASASYVAPDGSRRTLDVSVTLMREPGLEPAVARHHAARHHRGGAGAGADRAPGLLRSAHAPAQPLLLRERFAEGMARARRAKGLAAILFLDLDRFKRRQRHPRPRRRRHAAQGRGRAHQRLRARNRLAAALRRSWAAEPRSPAWAGTSSCCVLAPLERPEDAAKVAARVLESLTRPFSLKRGAEVTTTRQHRHQRLSERRRRGRDADEERRRGDVPGQGERTQRLSLPRREHERRGAGAHGSGERLAPRPGAQRVPAALSAAGRGRAAATSPGSMRSCTGGTRSTGMLPAAEFVAPARTPTVVTPMSEWLVRSACLQLRAWYAMGLPPLYLSLTLPPGAAERGDLPRLVREAIAQAGVDPGLLMISLRLRLRPARCLLRTLEAMQALQAMGVRLVLDDFGNGPAAFSSLGQYPLSMVRLEASFLRGLARDGDLAAVTRAHDPHGARAQPGRDRHRRRERRAGLSAARDRLRPRTGPRVRHAVAAEDVPALLSNVRAATRGWLALASRLGSQGQGSRGSRGSGAGLRGDLRTSLVIARSRCAFPIRVVPRSAERSP